MNLLDIKQLSNNLTDCAHNLRVERQLHESEERFRQFFDYSPDAYLLLCDGLFIDCNKAAELLLRCDRLQICGQKPEYFSPEYQPDGRVSSVALAETVARAIHSGRSTEEWLHQRLDGTVFWTESTLSVITLKGQQVIICSWREMTTRKRLESKIKSITDSTSDAIIMIDCKGLVTFWNPAAEHMFGYSVDEIIDKNFHNLMVPKRYLAEHCAAFALFKHTGEGNAVNRTVELRALRKNGQEISVELSLSALLYGKEWHAIGIVRDISDRKLAEETHRLVSNELSNELIKTQLLNDKLVESNRRLAEVSHIKSDFLANMSHELRTPLNAVIGFSDVLQRQHFGALNQKQQEYVSYILSNGKHLLTLINGVLDLSQVESGTMKLLLVTCSLSEMLTEAVIMLKGHALKGGIDLQLSLAPATEITIMVDRTKLKQILYNLMSNAIKFTSPGGKVTVSARLRSDEGGGMGDDHSPHPASPHQNCIEISVNDTGIGIKKEDIPKLFHAFTQLESSISKKYRGTGLGLALTKQLVELHGGRIWLESEFGSGSSFRFTLPLLPVMTEESLQQSHREALTAKDLVPVFPLPASTSDEHVKAHKILIVEDNEYNRILLVDILSGNGYEVIEATDGLEGIALAKQLMPDLILMDIQMPSMDGMTACRILKADPATRDMKIIAVTALAMVGDKEAFIAAGFDDYLPKPININEIPDRVIKWLNGEITI